MSKLRLAILLAMLAIVCGVAVLAMLGAQSVRRPWFQSAACRQGAADFKTATTVPSLVDRPQPGKVREWNAPLTFGSSPTKVTITGLDHFGAIHVTYADDPQPRPAFQYEEYTSTLEVRAKDSRLYVHRVITFFWTEYRLAVFDLAARKEFADCLIAPEDLR